MIFLEDLETENLRLPAFFHPTRTLCVGFEEDFLCLLRSELHPRDALILESCHNAMAALFSLNRAHNASCSRSSGKKDLTHFCFERISSSERFQCFSTIVFSSRPSINQILYHIEHIHDWRIKKVLVAEPNEAPTALEALRTRLIDALLFTGEPRLITRTIEWMHRLQRRYFVACSNAFLLAGLKKEASEKHLHDGINAFLQRNPAIVEFYRIDSYGTYLFLGECGEQIVLSFPQSPQLPAPRRKMNTKRCHLEERNSGSLCGNAVVNPAFLTLSQGKIVTFREIRHEGQQKQEKNLLYATNSKF
jgi:hypothetical protein